MRLPDYFKDYVFDQLVTVDENGVATSIDDVEDLIMIAVPYKKIKEWVVNALQPGDTSGFLKTLLFQGQGEDMPLIDFLLCLYDEMGEEDFADEMREHFKKRIKRLKNDPLQEVSSTIDGSARAMAEAIIVLIKDYASKEIPDESTDPTNPSHGSDSEIEALN